MYFKFSEQQDWGKRSGEGRRRIVRGCPSFTLILQGIYCDFMKWRGEKPRALKIRNKAAVGGLCLLGKAVQVI